VNFAPAAAAELYRQGLHPRLFVGPDDRAALLAIGATPEGARLLAALRARTAPIADWILACDELPARLTAWNQNWTQPATAAIFQLPSLAFLAWLDDDDRRREAVRRVLAACPAAEALSRLGVRRYAYSASDHLAIAFDFVAAALPAEERAAFAAWAGEAAIRATLAQYGPASYYQQAGMNLAMNGLFGLLTTALAIAGEAGAPELETVWPEALRLFEASLHTVMGPEGYPEEDIGYGTAMVAHLAKVAEPLRRAGRFDVYAAAPRYARFGQAILHFVQPWGLDLSNTGDHGDDFGHREFVLARLAAETSDPALLWLATTLHYAHARVLPGVRALDSDAELPLAGGGQLPVTWTTLLALPALPLAQPPAVTKPPTAFRDRARGIVSFRSGWDADATLLVCDGSQRSPAAQGHAHASGGHVSLSALGEYFSIDTGRYNLEQSCHTVVLARGQSGRSTAGKWVAMKHAARLISYQPGELVDTASVDSSAQHDCYWAWRTVGLVKGAGIVPYAWIVDDINVADDWAEYVWQLQTSPENTIACHAASATLTGWRHGHHLAVHLALPAPHEYPRPHQLLAVTQDVAGPSSYDYVKDPAERAATFARPAAMVHGPVFQRPLLKLHFAGYNGRCLALLLPYHQGTPAPQVTRLDTLPGSFAVRIATATVADTFIFAHDHGLLQAGGVDARGAWCLVRHDRTSGRVLTCAVAPEGRFLSTPPLTTEGPAHA
jgi:hypothetical protein